MKNFVELKKVLLGGASVVAVGMFMGPALAQAQMETVVVTGIRASLSSSQAIKQNSDQVVDSITAVDIGALPDRTVAEALQRVPGVQLVRADAVRDPVRYGGTGNGVFIRGLSWVQALTNGRDTFSAMNGQSLSFSDISANLMAGVDVYKNPNAKMIEGGVGGTVDLRTRKPFDQDGLVIAGSAEYTYGELRGKGTPSVDVLVSDRFNTRIGEIGILLSLDYQDLVTRTNGISGSRYSVQTASPAVSCAGTPCTTVYVPNDTVGYRQMNWEQSRTAGDLSLQWRPNEKLEFTATAIYSKADPHEEEFSPGFKVEQTAGTTATSNTSSPAAYTYDAAGNWTGGKITDVRPYNFDTRIGQNHRLNADYSLNMKWTPTDDWTITADAQYAESRATSRSMTAYTALKNKAYFNFFAWSGCTPAGPHPADGPNAECLTWGGGQNYFWAGNQSQHFDMTMNVAGDTPTIGFTNAAAMADKSNYFWAAAMDHLENNYAKAYSFRGDISKTFGGAGILGWIKSVDLGGRHEYKDAITRQTGWNWGVTSLQSWDGYTGGPTSALLAKVGFLTSTLPDQSQLYNFGNFMGQTVPSVWLPKASLLERDTRAVATILAPARTQNDWNALAARNGCTGVDYKCMAVYQNANPQADNVSGGINDQQITTWAGYAMANFAHDTFFGSETPIDGNVGVRIVHTALDTSAGKLVLPSVLTACNPVTATANPAWGGTGCGEYNAAQTFVGAGGTIAQGAVAHEYTDVMPSANLRAHLTDQLIARFAYSQAIVRPDISYTQNYSSVGFAWAAAPYAGYINRDSAGNVIGLTGTAGNPNLKPMHVQQYDASMEWYFSPSGSLTVALFHKDLSGYFYSDTRPLAITRNGITETFRLTSTYNGPSGKVQGVELGWQQFFDSLPGAWAGIGIQANYTKIFNSGGANQTVNVFDAAQVANANTPLPLEGMSNDSFNLAAMYEKYGISARLAYNWRSGYLLTSSAANINQPIWTKNYGQLDGSVFYTLFDHYKLGVQATNILKANTQFTVGYANRHPWYQTVDTDRKFSFVVRASW